MTKTSSRQLQRNLRKGQKIMKISMEIIEKLISDFASQHKNFIITRSALEGKNVKVWYTEN